MNNKIIVITFFILGFLIGYHLNKTEDSLTISDYNNVKENCYNSISNLEFIDIECIDNEIQQLERFNN